ncbi:uncharacterized protein LOC134775276 isoform X2 [Penaeus indicus]|uniref:uncharacterized protein LOC134775276 isoform X2 n=1 Tax=Penaeus indicus TaxID=29960 RepID=UPI00300D31CE
MSDLRLLLLVGLLSLSPGQGERFFRSFSISCSDYRVLGTIIYYPSEGMNRTLLTLPIEDTNQTLYVGPKANGTSKVLLKFGGKSESVNLTTQLQIRLWDDGIKFCVEVSGERICNNHTNYFEIESNDTFSLDCPSISQTSGPPEDVAPTSPSSISAVDGDKSSKTVLDTTAGKD